MNEKWVFRTSRDNKLSKIRKKKDSNEKTTEFVAPKALNMLLNGPSNMDLSLSNVQSPKKKKNCRQNDIYA